VGRSAKCTQTSSWSERLASSQECALVLLMRNVDRLDARAHHVWGVLLLGRSGRNVILCDSVLFAANIRTASVGGVSSVRGGLKKVDSVECV
jgi:hypothetical protein